MNEIVRSRPVVINNSRSNLHHWHIRKCFGSRIFLQCEQHKRSYKEGKVYPKTSTGLILTPSSQNTINAITLVSFGLGNIIGTEIFQPKDAPAYIPGKIAILVLLSAQIFISLLLRWINIRLNKKKQAHLVAEKERRGWTDADVQKERERHAFLDLTDKQYVFPLFYLGS